MVNFITVSELIHVGLSQDEADLFLVTLEGIMDTSEDPASTWSAITKQLLSKKPYPFALHLLLFTRLYPEWPANPSHGSAWIPDAEIKQSANIQELLNATSSSDVATLHKWSNTHYPEFWHWTIDKLGIAFKTSASALVNLDNGVSKPVWFPGAKLNIADSCFQAPANSTAVLYRNDHGTIQKVSYGELEKLSNQIANSLVSAGFKAGDAIGICMPMNLQAVANYLGIIKMGGVVVSIADSFSAQEIHVRLKITNAKAIFTQDKMSWAGKIIALHPKVDEATQVDNSKCKIILLPYSDESVSSTSINTIHWSDFFVSDDVFTSHACEPMAASNILFSSGTTADPKAIVWNHTTPIRVAADAFYHQNIKAGDVLCWPTNLGWMMGPWLIYAALINKAAIALFADAPKDEIFGKFVQDTNVTMLGVVPTLVATWKQSHCMESLNWNSIKVFSSSGECSNPEDMLYLMSLANYKPVIEYCGGTEIGGSYISSTVIQHNYPSLFTTPSMGMNVIIIDEIGSESDQGEVAIIPPSIGLSTELLNANHENVYYKDMPVRDNSVILRRHGDQIKRFDNGTYCILGRSDDTMNLGGIKVSSAEIERALAGVENILEVAAIAVSPPNNGPSKLVIYAVALATLDKAVTLKTMQSKINQHLNPLFKIADLEFVDMLPKTASNKIMRRQLRAAYEKSV